MNIPFIFFCQSIFFVRQIYLNNFVFWPKAHLNYFTGNNLGENVHSIHSIAAESNCTFIHSELNSVYGCYMEQKEICI